jgi:hypothetical protein
MSLNVSPSPVRILLIRDAFFQSMLRPDAEPETVTEVPG